MSEPKLIDRVLANLEASAQGRCDVARQLEQNTVDAAIGYLPETAHRFGVKAKWHRESAEAELAMVRSPEFRSRLSEAIDGGWLTSEGPPDGSDTVAWIVENLRQEFADDVDAERHSLARVSVSTVHNGKSGSVAAEPTHQHNRPDELLSFLTPSQVKIVRFLWSQPHGVDWDSLPNDAFRDGENRDDAAVKRALERLQSRLNELYEQFQAELQIIAESRRVKLDKPSRRIADK